MYTYDRSTLYVISGTATESQVRTAFETGTESFRARHNFTCTFTVNTVLNREGKPVGLSYVHVSCPGMFNALIGNNIDGSDRIAEAESDLDPDRIIDSWADEVDETMASRTKLPPLVTLEPIVNDQGETITLAVSRAHVVPLASGALHNVLISQNVPKCITNGDIMTKLKRYSTDRDYPKIQRIGEDVKITYSPDTDDARFALLMIKVLRLKTVTLFFRHMYALDKRHSSPKTLRSRSRNT